MRQWCRDRGWWRIEGQGCVVLEELHDAENPGVAARGASGEGEVVSLDDWMDSP